MKNKPAWKVSRVVFTGEPLYPFLVFLTNAYMNNARQTWHISNFNNDDYDLDRVTWEISSSLYTHVGQRCK